jgi:transposase
MAFPPNLDELIAADHPVRIVNEVLEKVDISSIIAQYKPGGTSSYHPRMLLKVLVYAYINNIYSSRKIAEAVQQHIAFMWLAGMTRPDHNTINRFRGQRLQESLQPVLRISIRMARRSKQMQAATAVYGAHLLRKTKRR